MQVVIAAAPGEGLKVPGGQGVGRVEFFGQKLPGVHKMGTPEEQK